MPELSRFKGMVVQMYFNDMAKHYKPHIHVVYNKSKAVIAPDGKLLAGKLPPKQMRNVLAWIILREEELRDEWKKAVKKEKLNKIKP